MGRSVDKTFHVLLRSRGRQPREVLLSALDEPDGYIQARAVSALILLHPDQGTRAVIDSFDRLGWPARAEAASG